MLAGCGTNTSSGWRTLRSITVVDSFESSFNVDEWLEEFGVEYEDCALAADVTQAFVHADMDEKIITRIPRDMHGMEVIIEGKRTIGRLADCAESSVWLPNISATLAETLLCSFAELEVCIFEVFGI